MPFDAYRPAAKANAISSLILAFATSLQREVLQRDVHECSHRQYEEMLRSKKSFITV